MSDRAHETDRAALSEAIRDACLRAATEAYEDGGLQGLCAEGRWELALDALRTVDLREALARADAASPDARSGAAAAEGTSAAAGDGGPA